MANKTNKYPGIKELPNNKYAAFINIYSQRQCEIVYKRLGTFQDIEHAKEIRKRVADLIGKGKEKMKVEETTIERMIAEFRIEKGIKKYNKN